MTINDTYTFDDDMEVPEGKSLTIGDNVDLNGKTLTIDGQMTVNGIFNLNGGTLDGSGSLDADAMTWGSTISGSLRITTGSVTLANDMTITENANVVVNGDITSESTYTLTVSGSATVKTGDVTGDVTVSGSANVAMGAVDGDVTNNGSGEVTVESYTGDLVGNVTTTTKLSVAEALNKAKAFRYPDPDQEGSTEYTYVGTFEITDGETPRVTYKASDDAFTTESVDAVNGEITQAAADLARFVGAVYRFDNGNSVNEITTMTRFILGIPKLQAI